MKSNESWYYQSATALLQALSTKQISAVELLTATIARIEQLDKKINAVVVHDFERAYSAAKAADEAIAHGKQLPLLGLPITVKESFHVTGLSSSWGNPLYKNWQPTQDALVIARLKAAGAIIIGKTNVPYMLHDWQTFNDIYGTTNNPWDLTVTPGGSSGGSAAALAAGFVSLELGSDLAGSLRVPAHFCGVLTHKPSFDLIPLRGAAPPAVPPTSTRIDFAVAGPMARTANDLELALTILAGPDELVEGKAYRLSLPAPRSKHLKDFRVLILDTHPLCPTSQVIQQAMARLEERLLSLGVSISHHPEVQQLAKVTQNYSFLLGAFFAADIPQEEYEKIEASVRKGLPNDLGISSCLSRGTVSKHRDWLLETRLRGQLRQVWRELFKNIDVILCPVMPTVAFPHDHSDHEKRKIAIDGALFPYSSQLIWISLATLFGLPATVIPIDYSQDGLPIGVQIIGDYLEDNTTIQFAKLYSETFGGFIAPNLANI